MNKKVWLVSGMVTASLLMIGGCSSNSPTSSNGAQSLSDGSAGDISMEFTQMSTESTTGLAKLAATAGSSLDSIDTVVIKQSQKKAWTYDSASSWWTCSYVDTFPDGRVFSRVDSLRFIDSASRARTAMPRWVTSNGWQHIRNITRQGVNTYNSRFEMNVAVTKGEDTTATWNGSITGIWNGDSLLKDTVTNVVRKYANVAGIRWWRFPSSGTIDIETPLRSWLITFMGKGVADATVTRKSDNKTQEITINVRTGIETVK